MIQAINRSGKVRIIGGKWRGRQLYFPALPGLRPTADRLRETAFNWLVPKLAGATCLDLFAGSGALGFEALSRGAERVVMVEQAAPAIAQLKANAAKLNANGATILHNMFPALTPFSDFTRFDIVFLDPPFHQGMIQTSCYWLEQHACLNAHAWIYLEAEIELMPLPVPVNWVIVHSKKAGQVGYHLAQRQD